MKRFSSIIGLCAVFALAFTSTNAYALFNTKKVEGTISSVEENILTIMQPSSDELKVALQVQVNDKTEYKEIASIQQLKEGDQVEISYKEENGRNIATSVAKIEPTKKRS